MPPLSLAQIALGAATAAFEALLMLAAVFVIHADRRTRGYAASDRLGRA